MKRNVIIFLFLALWTVSAFSQYFQPTSSLVFRNSELQQSAMSNKIRSQRALFKSLDIDELKIKSDATTTRWTIRSPLSRTR